MTYALKPAFDAEAQPDGEPPSCAAGADVIPLFEAEDPNFLQKMEAACSAYDDGAHIMSLMRQGEIRRADLELIRAFEKTRNPAFARLRIEIVQEYRAEFRDYIPCGPLRKRPRSLF